jgi:hypothetical protein
LIPPIHYLNETPSDTHSCEAQIEFGWFLGENKEQDIQISSGRSTHQNFSVVPKSSFLSANSSIFVCPFSVAGNRDVCANKVRLLVMQMVRKVLTFNVYNKLFFREQTRPEQCHNNVLVMRNMNSVGHNICVTA